MKRVLGSDAPKSQLEQGIMYETPEQKAERNRERNREHAKKTRLRKKEMIEGMKIRLLELQRESVRLEQLVEENNTANILLCLGGKNNNNNNNNNSSCSDSFLSSSSSSSVHTEDDHYGVSVTTGSVSGSDLPVSLAKGNIIDQLKQKVRSEAAMTITKDHYLHSALAEHGIEDMEGDDDEDSYEQTSSPIKDSHSNEVDQDVLNRRARNRMHAKLTRDRKKLFTNKMQETIKLLERHNEQLKMKLGQSQQPSITVSSLSSALPRGSPPQQCDPLTAFCYYAELWNKANEARLGPVSGGKTIQSH